MTMADYRNMNMFDRIDVTDVNIVTMYSTWYDDLIMSKCLR